MEKETELYLICRIKNLEEYVNHLKNAPSRFINPWIDDKPDKEKVHLKNEVEYLKKEVDFINEKQRIFLDSITPSKVYHHKKRGNTTVKFLNGDEITVHRMAGDKDCLETAIVYAVFKKIFPKKLLTNLVAEATETGGRRCKKVCKN